MAILLGVFAGLIVWNRAGTPRVRRVSSVLVFGGQIVVGLAMFTAAFPGSAGET